MSLMFIDGFEHYTAAQANRKWPLNTSLILNTSGGRFGGGYVTLNHVNTFMRRNFPQTASWVIGIAMNVVTIPGSPLPFILLSESGTVQCQLDLNLDGTLRVSRAGTALTGASSTVAITPGIWYYVEWKVTIADSIAANSCKVRLNGVDIINVPAGQDTKNTGNAYATALELRGPLSFANGFFDDFYVLNQSGTVNNDFLGDMRVETLYPNGVGTTTQWTPSAGANYICVDDPQANDDTDYVSSATVNQKDTYAMSNLTGNPVSIAGIQTLMLTRKDDAGSRTALMVTRSGGTDYEGTASSVLDNYNYAIEVRETDPATSAAWTTAGINAMEVGVKVAS